MATSPRVGCCFLRHCGVLCALASVAGCGGEQGPASSTNSVSPTVADEFVIGHNQVRSEVIQPPNYPGTWAPLPPMVWSTSIASSAQTWADRLRDTADCALSHDSTSALGENLAGGMTAKFSPSDAIYMWVNDEKPRYVYNPVYAFDGNTGNYTQIVWRNSIEVGCAISQCPTALVVIVCRYNPVGNVIGEQPY
jgi:pathogenesis-related protein 1